MKTKVIFKRLFLLTAFICFFSCTKRISETNPEFIGKWAQAKIDRYPCGPFVIEISANGDGLVYSKSLESECANGDKNKYEGKVVLKKNRLKIGHTKNFEVTLMPLAIDSVKLETPLGTYYYKIKMELDGQKYYKN